MLMVIIFWLNGKAGSEIAPSWSPVGLKIEYWQPEFHNWSPVGDLPLSSEPFANRCLTFYPSNFFEVKMKGVFLLTTSISRKLPCFFIIHCKTRTVGEKTTTH